jgi:uncharacterized protein YgiM (DUF1202 family)
MLLADQANAAPGETMGPAGLLVRNQSHRALQLHRRQRPPERSDYAQDVQSLRRSVRRRSASVHTKEKRKTRWYEVSHQTKENPMSQKTTRERTKKIADEMLKNLRNNVAVSKQKKKTRLKLDASISGNVSLSEMVFGRRIAPKDG